MDQETAISLWAVIERQTFEFVNDNAEAERWQDENTPPTDELPVFAVRLDAVLDRGTYERGFRLFVQITGAIAKEDVGDHVIELLETAKEAGVEFAFENAGIALS